MSLPAMPLQGNQHGSYGEQESIQSYNGIKQKKLKWH